MKDTFYFSHDYNARSDQKIKKLLAKHGLCGYGIYWAIVEDLYNNANALPLDYESIAYDLRCESDIIISVINDFGLFAINENFFSSDSVERRLFERKEKSANASKSAKARWEKEKSNANALQSQSDSNAIKESKEKESKEDVSKDEKRKLELESEYSKNKKYYQGIIDLGENAHKQLKSIASFLIKNDMVDLISLKPLTAHHAEDIYKKMRLKFDNTDDVEVFFIKMNGYINKKYASLYAMAIAWLNNQKNLIKD